MNRSQAIHLDQIIEIINEWKIKYSASFVEKIYIFGSLINRNGRHFVPQGGTASDVDLVLILSEHANEAISRYHILKKLREASKFLEDPSHKNLRRENSDPIYSLLPLTKYEVHHCIHKGHDPKLFTTNLFLDVETQERLEFGISELVDYDYHFENLEQFSVIRLCQNYRNKFLKSNHRGDHFIDPFNGDTVFPKEILRAGALLNFVHLKGDSNRRTDLEEGQTYLVDLLRKNQNKGPELKALSEKISGNMFARSDSEPLDADDMMLMHELMFDNARTLAIPSVRDAIREVMETLQPK